VRVHLWQCYTQDSRPIKIGRADQFEELNSGLNTDCFQKCRSSGPPFEVQHLALGHDHCLSHNVHNIAPYSQRTASHTTLSPQLIWPQHSDTRNSWQAEHSAVSFVPLLPVKQRSTFIVIFRLLWFIHVWAFYRYDCAGGFYFRRRSSALFRCGATEERLLLICLSVHPHLAHYVIIFCSQDVPRLHLCLPTSLFALITSNRSDSAALLSHSGRAACYGCCCIAAKLVRSLQQHFLNRGPYSSKYVLTPVPKYVLTPAPKYVLTPVPKRVLTPIPKRVLTPIQKYVITPVPNFVLYQNLFSHPSPKPLNCFCFKPKVSQH
jgi:hypothetical protein